MSTTPKKEVTIQRVDDSTYMVDARTPLEELAEVLGMSLDYEDMDEEVDTLGGLVFVLSGHVPVRGEVVETPVRLGIRSDRSRPAPASDACACTCPKA